MLHRGLPSPLTFVTPPAVVLRRGITVLRERGLAKGAVHDPSSGAVDATGAMLVACGVSAHDLTDDLSEAVVVVPRAHLPGFSEAWTALDAAVDGLEDWQDRPSTGIDDVVALMGRIADELDRRVIRP